MKRLTIKSKQSNKIIIYKMNNQKLLGFPKKNKNLLIREINLKIDGF